MFEKQHQRAEKHWFTVGLLSFPSHPHPRYEDEINKRTAAENDFVVLKKVRDEGGQEVRQGHSSLRGSLWLES